MKNVELNSKEWLSLTDLPNEEWRQSRFENYFISNYGRVKSLRHVHIPLIETRYYHKRTYPERIVKLSTTKHGYVYFRFSKDGKLHNGLIHQLVAEAFLPNPSNLPFINHRNEDKSDNRVENLEYCSAKYNSNYGTCQQRRAVSVKQMRRNRNISIDQYTIDGMFVRHYSKKGEIDDAGFNLKTVLRSCNHKCETSQGFVWRYEGEPYTKPEYVDSAGGTIRRTVLCYDQNGQFITKYNNLLEAAEAIGGRHKRPGISSCALGKTEQAYGYIWRYANN